MSAKEIAKKTIDNSSADATLEDIIYTLYIRARLDEGEREIKDGKGIPHEEVERILYKKYVIGERDR